MDDKLSFILESSQIPKKKQKRKLSSLDKYVIFSITAMIVYTVINLLILCLTGMTSDTLTACFFGFFGGEIVTCALIKIFKLKEDKNDGRRLDDIQG